MADGGHIEDDGTPCGRGGAGGGSRLYRGSPGRAAAGHQKGAGGAARDPARTVRLIGDGSTAYTGAQPHQPRPQRIEPGGKPPQFVVFSWDGAGEDGQKLFSHFRAVGKKYGATMTYFLSGVYLLPGDKAELYEPPRHEPGTSAIGFNDIQGIRDTVAQLRGAWEDGNETGTHFNGHFCGPDGGVSSWTPEEWRSEIEQAVSFVRNWKANSGLRHEPPLPFDYARELVGGRAPCLEGQRNLIRALRQLQAAERLAGRPGASGAGAVAGAAGGSGAEGGLGGVPLRSPRGARPGAGGPGQAGCGVAVPSKSTKAGSTWAARSAPVRALPQLSAFFRWKCTIWRV